ncbi:hypothetical protein J2T57_001088 [Natronocella acetinitrilica]|uniref:Carboxypeptidase regulatory-like domain-containing protein n=1 Tax=Natronocella acetinitrilica TaxID=414046 RepID=A0AAE3G1T3_9GAMM|nr:hypothetical protein [Natronocella acetinitrilica]MCP1673989.1 hypothetical protein [Natronocella acetinitrilica]
MQFKKWLLVILMLLALGALAACNSSGGGGGSSGSNDNGGGGGDDDPPAAVTAFQGEVLAPGGELAFLQPHPVERMLAWVSGQSFAGMSGLSPVAGITVELIRVDNDGNKIGDVIATATTSLTGTYNLTLPENTSLPPSANLVIRAVGHTQTLRAQAVEDDIKVDPTSEFVLRKLIDFQVPLDQIAARDVVRIRGDIDALGIDAGASIEAAAAALEAASGSYMESQAESLSTPPAESIAAVLGDWRVSSLRLEMGYRTQEPPQTAGGTIGMLTDGGGFQLFDGGGDLQGRDLEETTYYFAEQYNFTGGQNLFTEFGVDPINEDDSFPLILESNGALLVQVPFEEDVLDGDFATRQPAADNRFRAIGDNLFVGVNRFYERLYGVTNDALDTNRFFGERFGADITLIGRVDTNLTASNVSGTYGFVQFGVQLEDNYTGTVGYLRNFNFDGMGGVDVGNDDEIEIEHFYGSAVEVNAVGPDPSTLDYEVNDGGLTLVENDEPLIAFNLTADAQVFWTNDVTSTLDEAEEEVIRDEYGLLMAVKLPASQPDLNGKRYRMQGISLGVGRAGGGDVAELDMQLFGDLVFDGGNVQLVGARERLLERDSKTGRPEFISGERADSDTVGYSLGSNGSLTVEAGNIAFDGFVSADGQMIVLRRYANEGTGMQTLGLWIGTLVAD